jgi:hypothetical protein
MTRDQAFAQAVQLAAAFVANGDIRLNNSVREDNQSFEMLRELVDQMYLVVRKSYDDCTSSEG